MSRFSGYTAIVLMVAALSPCSSAPIVADKLYEAGNFAMRVESRDGFLRPVLCARKNEKWTSVLCDPALTEKPPQPNTSSALSDTPQNTGLFKSSPRLPWTRGEWNQNPSPAITLFGENADWTFTQTTRFETDHLHVTLTASHKNDPVTTAAPRIEFFLASYALHPDAIKDNPKLSFVFAPGLRPRADQVIGDHLFRAPAAIVQHGNTAAAIVPDLDSIRDHRAMTMILDVDYESSVSTAPLMSYGFCTHERAGHVYFRHTPGAQARASDELTLECDIFIDANTPEPSQLNRNDAPSILQKVSAYQWQKYGSRNFESPLPQTMPFAEYAQVCYPAAFSEKAGDKQLGWWQDEISSRPVGGVYSGWGYTDGQTSWQAWFNNLRSAYGMYWWGNRLGNTDWVEKANRMLNMALVAPQKEGAFPCVYNNMSKEWKGCLVSRGGGYYHSPDMAWKGFWLLRWHLDFEQKAEILDYCRKLGDFFVSRQEPSGAIASWFTEDFKAVDDLRESAQTALPGWFLVELYRATGDQKYLTAAQKAGDFVAREVIPQMRYYDFETFFSCSPKPAIDGGRNHEAMRDKHTQQLPQNTLSMQWCAELQKTLFQVTGRREYLVSGQDALEAMLMYQNIWSLPFRRFAYTFGGFGAQNSDGEYNDARQSQFGCTLCDYGVLLGRKDYFERGVAAVRASLALINHPRHIRNGVYPQPNYSLGLEPENTGHGGTDEFCVRTGFDWGEGSGLTGAAYVMGKYGDVFVHPDVKWAVGIDGVYARLRGNELKVENLLNALRDPYTTEVVSRVTILPSQEQAPVNVNGHPWNGTDPVKAIAVKPIASTASLPLNPSWDFDGGNLQGWTSTGHFPDLPSNSRRTDFGPEITWFLGTCEDGNDGHADELEGEVYSPEFVTSCTAIQLYVGGGSNERVSVSLIDANTQEILYTERGTNNERLTKREWTMATHAGKPVFIRVRDHSPAGWAHINVARISCIP